MNEEGRGFGDVKTYSIRKYLLPYFIYGSFYKHRKVVKMWAYFVL